MFAILTEVHMLHQLSSAEFNKSQEHELHMSHFSILNRLLRFGDAKTPQWLAAQMNVTRATMTHSLARLSERGYVELLPNPGDKRSKLVYLTPAGRKARDQAIGRVAPRMHAYADALGSERLGDLLTLLRELHATMNPEEEDPSFY